MGRILRIVFYILVFVLIFYWFEGIIKSCNQKKVEARMEEPVPEASAESIEDGVEDIMNEFFEEDDVETEVPAEGETTNESSDDLASDTAIVEEENAPEVIEASPSPAEPSPSPPQPAAQTSVSGKYLIIAGNYLVKSNAEKMIDRLRRMGYSDAEMVVFDLSQYHTVCAGRFDRQNAASVAAAELKSRGIDCYVHTRQN